MPPIPPLWSAVLSAFPQSHLCPWYTGCQAPRPAYLRCCVKTNRLRRSTLHIEYIGRDIGRKTYAAHWPCSPLPSTLQESRARHLQFSIISCKLPFGSISIAYKLSKPFTLVASLLNFWEKASERLCAGSVDFEDQRRLTLRLRGIQTKGGRRQFGDGGWREWKDTDDQQDGFPDLGELHGQGA